MVKSVRLSTTDVSVVLNHLDADGVVDAKHGQDYDPEQVVEGGDVDGAEGLRSQLHPAPARPRVMPEAKTLMMVYNSRS